MPGTCIFYFTSLNISLFYLLFPLLLVVYGGICHSAGLRLKKFSSAFLSIESDADLFRFKEFIRQQMKASLLAIFVGGFMLLFYIMFAFSGTFGPGETLGMLGLFGFLMIWSRRIRSYEKKIASVATSTEFFQQERDAVVKSWHSNLGPQI